MKIVKTHIPSFVCNLSIIGLLSGICCWIGDPLEKLTVLDRSPSDLWGVVDSKMVVYANYKFLEQNGSSNILVTVNILPESCGLDFLAVWICSLFFIVGGHGISFIMSSEE